MTAEKSGLVRAVWNGPSALRQTFSTIVPFSACFKAICYAPNRASSLPRSALPNLNGEFPTSNGPVCRAQITSPPLATVKQHHDRAGRLVASLDGD